MEIKTNPQIPVVNKTVQLPRVSPLQETLKKPFAPDLTANTLKAGLSGTIEERTKESKSILLTLEYGKRPEVVFSGFWNGKLISSAMNGISRAYRLQRHKNIRVNATQLTSN
jgi:hypothetical protein